MAFNSAMEALGALVHAYYDERNMEATLSCVTDDIEWVGTEKNDSAKGKEELRELLKADIESFPDSFEIELDEPKLQQIGSDGVMITVTGRQVEVPGIIGGFTLRGTACCIKTEAGWLVANVHTSVPNAGAEKYNLERELDETRKKEKLLLSGIPNGVDFCAYLQNNAMINVVEEDIPLVVNAVAESMEEKKTVSVMYRIHVKGGEDILQRLDAKQMGTDLGEDDAVRKLLSGESFISTTYRLKLKNNTWFWIRLNAAVVERRENYIRVYGVFSDYNAVIKAQQEMESSFDLLTNPYNNDVEVTGIMRDVSEAVRAEMVVNKLLEIDYDSIATINIETGIATPFTVSASEVGMKKILDIQEEQADMAVGLEEFFRTYCSSADVEQVIQDNSMPVILKALETKAFHECAYSIDLGKGIEHIRAIYAYLNAHLSKPIEPEVLYEKIAYCCKIT